MYVVAYVIFSRSFNHQTGEEGRSEITPCQFCHLNSGTAKDKMMRFDDFSWIWLGYKISVFAHRLAEWLIDKQQDLSHVNHEIMGIIARFLDLRIDLSIV